MPEIKSSKKVDFNVSDREEEEEIDFRGYNLKPLKPAFDYDFGTNYKSGLESNDIKGMAIPIFKRIVITPKTAVDEEEKVEEKEVVLSEHEIYRNQVFDEHERSYRSASLTSERAGRSIKSMRQTITSFKDMKDEFEGTI